MHPTTIAGKTFTVADKYTEGAVLTANEASALNQLRRENIRNNLASTIKDQVESGAFDQSAAQTSVDQYATSYEFGVRTGGGGGSRDPVETTAMQIARDTIRANIASKGKKVSDYSAKQISEAAAKLIAKDPKYRKEAEKRVKALAAGVADLDIDDLVGEPNAELESETGEPEVDASAPTLTSDTVG